MDQSNTNMYKLVVVGDTSTGKTNLIQRYVNNKFSESSLPTIGVEFHSKNIKIQPNNGEEQNIQVQIWDTAGQERFRGIAGSYYRHSSGILLVYDITLRQSFDNLGKWLSEIKKYAEQDAFIYVIGNKKDLVEDREVTY